MREVPKVTLLARAEHAGIRLFERPIAIFLS